LLPQEGKADAADAELLKLVSTAVGEEVPNHFEALALSQGIEAWLRAVFACNQYIDAQAPWTLKKTDPERMQAVLATLVRAIVDLAIAIQPIVPGSAAKLLDTLSIPEGERDYAALADGERYARLAGTGLRIEAPMAIFPRLDMPVEG
jgi:methionyl-tRNA synthetase